MENQPSKRRPRYSGTHPRHFEQKYKELSPDKYVDDVQKVVERGQTPAGTHRPVCVQEILTILDLRPGMIGLDATLGYGGHAQEILPHIIPGGQLVGIDVDPRQLPKTEERLRTLGFGDEVLLVKRMNFAGLPQLMPQIPDGFDFILADLGVSSMQIDTPSRGMSYKLAGPLDLRLNPDKGEPASAYLRKVSEDDLTQLLMTNSDEPNARVIAQAIVKNADRLHTTTHLSTTIEVALQRLPAPKRTSDELKKALQRTFQSLRIAINDEFTVLEQFLTFLPYCLKSGGKAAILTFHSGEDRRVKKSFLEGFRGEIYSAVAPDPIRPSTEERNSNSRSSSAKLRWAIKK